MIRLLQKVTYMQTISVFQFVMACNCYGGEYDMVNNISVECSSL